MGFGRCELPGGLVGAEAGRNAAVEHCSPLQRHSGRRKHLADIGDAQEDPLPAWLRCEARMGCGWAHRRVRRACGASDRRPRPWHCACCALLCSPLLGGALGACRRYVKWTQESYPTAGGKEQLLKTLEAATTALAGCQRYYDDPRFLRLWVQYVSAPGRSPSFGSAAPPLACEGCTATEHTLSECRCSCRHAQNDVRYSMPLLLCACRRTACRIPAMSSCSCR